MATCKDCLHFDACESLLKGMGYTVDGDGYDADKRCDTFKEKSKYAEVVRCNDCDFRAFDDVCQEYYCNSAYGINGAITDNDFCSYGEEKGKTILDRRRN